MSLSFKAIATGEEYEAGGREGWRQLFELAERHGWKPAGTTSEYHDDWDGGYFSNEYQVITAEDAHRLAEAIRCALGDLEQDTRLQLWTTLTPAHLREAAAFFDQGDIMIS